MISMASIFYHYPVNFSIISILLDKEELCPYLIKAPPHPLHIFENLVY